MTPQELNEAVARKLGWEFKKSPFSENHYWVKGDVVIDLPAYSTSIEAAWEIPTKFPEIPYDRITAGFQIAIHSDGTWEAGWCSYPECFIVSAEADTAPLAICKAFLKLEGK